MTRPGVVDDFVEVCDVPDFEARFHHSPEAERFGTGANYQITGDAAREREFLGEVLDVGPGKLAGPDGSVLPGSAPPVKRGDIMLTNLNSCSYRLPGSSSKYLFRGDTVMATIDRETYRVGPVTCYVLLQANEERTRAAISKGAIWIPTGPLSTDDQRAVNKTIMAAYGEVVARGPGGYQMGKWKEPPCEPGDLVLYDCSYNCLDVTVRGEKKTLVHSDQIVKVVEGAVSL